MLFEWNLQWLNWILQWFNGMFMGKKTGKLTLVMEKAPFIAFFYLVKVVIFQNYILYYFITVW